MRARRNRDPRGAKIWVGSRRPPFGTWNQAHSSWRCGSKKAKPSSKGNWNLTPRGIEFVPSAAFKAKLIQTIILIDADEHAQTGSYHYSPKSSDELCWGIKKLR